MSSPPQYDIFEEEEAGAPPERTEVVWREEVPPLTQARRRQIRAELGETYLGLLGGEINALALEGASDGRDPSRLTPRRVWFPDEDPITPGRASRSLVESLQAQLDDAEKRAALAEARLSDARLDSG